MLHSPNPLNPRPIRGGDLPIALFLSRHVLVLTLPHFSILILVSTAQYVRKCRRRQEETLTQEGRPEPTRTLKALVCSTRSETSLLPPPCPSSLTSSDASHAMQPQPQGDKLCPTFCDLSIWNGWSLLVSGLAFQPCFLDGGFSTLFP